MAPRLPYGVRVRGGRGTPGDLRKPGERAQQGLPSHELASRMENSPSKCGNGVGRIERADNGRFPEVFVDVEGHPGNHGIGILRQQTRGRSADLRVKLSSCYARGLVRIPSGHGGLAMPNLRGNLWMEWIT